MKTLTIISVNGADKPTIEENMSRGKLILRDDNIRPEYIDISINEGKAEIRVNFADNSYWVGSIEDFKDKILK